MAEEHTMTAQKQAAARSKRKMARRSLVWNHVKICKGRGREGELHPTSSSPPQPQLLLPLPARGQSSGGSDLEPESQDAEAAETSIDLARMIVLHGYDPSVVEDDHFRSFVRRLNPEFKLPSRQDIEKVCPGIFAKSRTNLVDCCIQAPGSISFGVGTARSIEAGKEVIYLTCHFIDHQWNLHRVVLNAYEVLPHGDQYHVPLLGQVVSSLGNAVEHISYSVTYMYLSYKKPFMIAEEIMTDCVHKLKRCIERNRRSACHAANTKLMSATYMDQVLHSIAGRLLPDSDFTEGIFSDMGDLELTKPEFQVLLSQLGLDDPLDYDLHWYSCYCSLEILGQEIPGTESEPESILRSLWRDIEMPVG